MSTFPMFPGNCPRKNVSKDAKYSCSRQRRTCRPDVPSTRMTSGGT